MAGQNWSCQRKSMGSLAKAAVPLMDEIIKKHYEPGGTIIRAMAAKLFAGERITPHTDKHPSFHIAHRIHIPITTNDLFFTIGDQTIPSGSWKGLVNNQNTHSVEPRQGGSNNIYI